MRTFATALAQELGELQTRLNEAHDAEVKAQTTGLPAAPGGDVRVGLARAYTDLTSHEFVEDSKRCASTCSVGTSNGEDESLGSCEVVGVLALSSSPPPDPAVLSLCASSSEGSESAALRFERTACSWARLCSKAVASAKSASRVKSLSLRNVWETSSSSLAPQTDKASLFRYRSRTARSMDHIAFAGLATKPRWSFVHNMRKILKLFLVAWDIACVCVIISNAILIPFELCSSRGLGQEPAYALGTACFWSFDAAVRLAATAALVGREARRPRVSIRQTTPRAACDAVLLAVEWVQVVLFSDASGAMSSAPSALRFFELFRVAQVDTRCRRLPFTNLVEMVVSTNTAMLYYSVFRTTCTLMVGLHIVACLWYNLGSQSGGWVAQWNASKLEAISEPPSGFALYLASLHWALSQIHGTMDLQPADPNERAFAIITLLIAFVVNTSYVAIVTNLVLQLERRFSERMQQDQSVRQFLVEHQVSGNLAERIRNNIISCYSRKKNQEQEDAIMANLSPNLVSDLLAELRGPLLQNHCFFGSLGKRVFTTMCSDTLRVHNVMRGDCVFEVGDEGTCMHVISKGQLEYNLGLSRNIMYLGPSRRSSRQSNRGRGTLASAASSIASLLNSVWENASDGSIVREEVSLVRMGDYVSEASLWLDWTHVGTLHAISDGQLVSICDTGLQQLVLRYREVYQIACDYARTFMTAMERAQGTDLIPLEYVDILMASKSNGPARTSRHSLMGMLASVINADRA